MLRFFYKDDLSANNFVPINKQAGFFFIAIKEGSNKSDISKFIATKDSDTLKFISLNEESFNALLNYYVSEFYSNETDIADADEIAGTEEQATQQEPAENKKIDAEQSQNVIHDAPKKKNWRDFNRKR